MAQLRLNAVPMLAALVFPSTLCLTLLPALCQTPGVPVSTDVSGQDARRSLAQSSEQAGALLAAIRAGRLTLTVSDREGEQLRRLERDGYYAWPGRSVRRPAQPAEPAAGARSTLPSRGAFGIVPGEAGKYRVLDGIDDDTVPTPPSIDLLRALVSLSGRSTPERPLELMTLLRPPYRTPDHPFGSPTNVHSRGMAADLAAYAGHRVDSRRPEDSVRMMLALLRDLPPGRYRLGVPKAPELPAVVGQPHEDLFAGAPGIAATHADGDADISTVTASVGSPGYQCPGYRGLPVRAKQLAAATDSVSIRSRGQALTTDELAPAQTAPAAARRPLPVWPFFPPQQFAIENGVVAPVRKGGKALRDGAGRSIPNLLRFRNEEYAPEDALGDPRVKEALARARARGVDVWALFPDAADHIHLDVRHPR